ncbi:MAG: glycosyltransferase family 9 protein [Ignavibacteriaceae bacterium]
MIKPKNLLIVRTDRIGDVVLSLPLAEIVKKYYPECKITFLVRNYTKDILENHPFIDKIILLQEENKKVSILKNVKIIKSFGFDSGIIVYPTLQTSIIIFLSGIKNRIGTGYRWYSFLFNHKIFEHRKYAEKHELEYNVNLLNAFGINEIVAPGKVDFNLTINKKSEEKIKTLFEDNGINNDKLIIIIHPGSGGSAVDLPVNKFKYLVEELSKKDKFQILLTGSEQEIEICEKLKINNKIKNFAGILSLSELIALIDKCNIFVANSTGPLHIAAALGKYIVGFYPNLLVCSAKRWGPYTNKKIIFSPKKECSDCEREQCTKSQCMNSIEVKDVVEEIDKIYNFISDNGENNV